MAIEPTKKSAKKIAARKVAAAEPQVADLPNAVPEVEKPLVKKAARKVAARKPATAGGAAKTVIIARVDVGFGNSLFVRGGGAGLSWDSGTIMSCTNGDEWSWTSDQVREPLEFKVLLNDDRWSEGPNAVVLPGATFVFEPTF